MLAPVKAINVCFMIDDEDNLKLTEKKDTIELILKEYTNLTIAWDFFNFYHFPQFFPDILKIINNQAKLRNFDF